MHKQICMEQEDIQPQLLECLPSELCIHILSFFPFYIDFDEATQHSFYSKVMKMNFEEWLVFWNSHQYSFLESTFSKAVIPFVFGYFGRDLPFRIPRFLFHSIIATFGDESLDHNTFTCLSMHFSFMNMLSRCESVTIRNCIISEGVAPLKEEVPVGMDAIDFRVSRFCELHEHLLPLFQNRMRQIHFEFSKEVAYSKFFFPFLVQISNNLTYLSIATNEYCTDSNFWFEALKGRVGNTLQPLQLMAVQTYWNIDLIKVVQLQKNQSTIRLLKLIGPNLQLSNSSSLLHFPNLKQISTNSVSIKTSFETEQWESKYGIKLHWIS